MPNVLTSPATSNSSLTAIGTPSSGRSRGLPAPPTRVGLVGFHPRALVEHDPEGVQLPVIALDPLQAQVHQLARAHLALGDQLGLPGDPGVCEVCRVHWPGNLVDRLDSGPAGPGPGPGP